MVFLLQQNNVIKRMAVAELEVPSQCVLMKTLNNEKKFRPVVQKIALQINCKLGGSLWALRVQADRVEMKWNKKGTAVLVITSTDVDKSGQSYYGNTMCHYLDKG